VKRQSTPKKVSPKKLISFSYQSAGDKGILKLIETVRTGIPFAEFHKHAQTMPFTIEQWAEYLHVSVRTIQRSRKEDTAFQALQAERIVEIIMVYKHGIEVFSNQDKLNKWLVTRTATMGGKAPQDFLDTKLGVGLVNDELGRIEHGILA